MLPLQVVTETQFTDCPSCECRFEISLPIEDQINSFEAVEVSNYLGGVEAYMNWDVVDVFFIDPVEHDCGCVCYFSDEVVLVSDLDENAEGTNVASSWKCRACGRYWHTYENAKRCCSDAGISEDDVLKTLS